MTEQSVTGGDGAAAAVRFAADGAAAPYLPEPGRVTVLSATWCGHCTRLKTMLGHTGIPFTEVLIEEDPVAEQLAAEANGGDWLIPTVLFADGSSRVNPGLTGVQQRLAQLGAGDGAGFDAGAGAGSEAASAAAGDAGRSADAPADPSADRGTA